MEQEYLGRGLRSEVAKAQNENEERLVKKKKGSFKRKGAVNATKTISQKRLMFTAIIKQTITGAITRNGCEVVMWKPNTSQWRC